MLCTLAIIPYGFLGRFALAGFFPPATLRVAPLMVSRANFFDRLAEDGVL